MKLDWSKYLSFGNGLNRCHRDVSLKVPIMGYASFTRLNRVNCIIDFAGTEVGQSSHQGLTVLFKIFNSLPNDKTLDWSKSKAFADDRKKVLNVMIFLVFDRVENIGGKRENAIFQHFLLFPKCFQKEFHSGLLKLRLLQ